MGDHCALFSFRFCQVWYASYLKAKLQTMQEFVHDNLTKSAKAPVWPSWDGKWTSQKWRDLVTWNSSMVTNQLNQRLFMSTVYVLCLTQNATRSTPEAFLVNKTTAVEVSRHWPLSCFTSLEMRISAAYICHCTPPIGTLIYFVVGAGVDAGNFACWNTTHWVQYNYTQPGPFPEVVVMF